VRTLLSRKIFHKNMKKYMSTFYVRTYPYIMCGRKISQTPTIFRFGIKKLKTHYFSTKFYLVYIGHTKVNFYATT
jgi:hypothetical protein